MTGAEHADATGEIAITDASESTSLHLLRETADSNPYTVCGRWWLADHTGNETVTSDTNRCPDCFGTRRA